MKELKQILLSLHILLFMLAGTGCMSMKKDISKPKGSFKHSHHHSHDSKSKLRTKI